MTTTALGATTTPTETATQSKTTNIAEAMTMSSSSSSSLSSMPPAATGSITIGAIISIVVGVLCLLIVIVVIAIVALKRSRSSGTSKQHQHQQLPHDEQLSPRKSDATYGMLPLKPVTMTESDYAAASNLSTAQTDDDEIKADSSNYGGIPKKLTSDYNVGDVDGFK